MSEDDDGLDSPFTPPEKVTLSVRPPSLPGLRPPPPRAPQWGELAVTGTGPTLREHVEQIDPDAHAMPAPRPPTTAVSAPPGFGDTHAPRARPRTPTPAPQPRKEQRAWGEVDLLGVSSAIGAPVAIGGSEDAVEASEAVLSAPSPQAQVSAPSNLNVVEIARLPAVPPGHVYYCEACRAYVGPERVLAMSTNEGRVAMPICPTCRRFVRLESSTRSRGLDVVMLEALLWPFSREMVATVLANTVAFWVLSSAWVLGFPPLTMAALALALGVLATYGAAVIRSTSAGEDGPPPPSDAIGSWSIASAVIRHTAVFVLGGLPLGYSIVSGALGGWSPTERTVLVILSVIVFCLYVPAGQIVASTKETFFAAINPIVPIRFAFRVGGSYFLACAILFGFALAHLVCLGVAMAIGAVLFGPGILFGLVVAPVLVLGVLIEARMLGLLVREHRFDLNLL